MYKKILILTILTLAFLFNSDNASALSSRTCNPNVPKTVKYRPSYGLCNGNAAIILSGVYANAFSVVIKTVDHADRDCRNLPGAENSPFKTQRKETINGAVVNCLGASGFSPVFNGKDPKCGGEFKPQKVAKWISIKRKNSGQIKDVDIYCLKKPYPKTPVN